MSSLSRVLHVAKLNNLAHQLTPTEFDQFLYKMTKKFGKEIILRLLCNAFIEPSLISHRESLLDDMTKIISNIIECRKTPQIQQKYITKIDDIPSPLIGEISSYLNQNEYSLFCRTNRAIFIGSNTPNTLKIIELHKFKRYRSIHFANYPQITCLSFKLSQFHWFSMRQESISNRLQKILIYGNKPKYINDNVEEFINQNHLNLTNLQNAYFHGFAQFAVFAKLLAQFSMIQHLCLSSINLHGEVNRDKICGLFPNLTRLSLYDVSRSMANPMLTHYGSDLECLSVKQPPEHNYDDVKFMKLRKLLLWRPSLNTINGILNKTKFLREIVFAPYSSYSSLINIDQIHDMITKIIYDQLILEFLYISTKPHSFDAICNAIQSVLNATNDRKRENLEIALEIDCRQSFEALAFMRNISKIVNNLIVSNTNNFMVGFECNDHGEFNMDVMLKVINDFIESTPTVKLIKSTKLGFIIGNKQCKMHRHHKWWNDFGTIQFYH